MNIIARENPFFVTKNIEGKENGFLVPLYNVHDSILPDGARPEQVYLTVVSPGEIKGPHLHFIRTGYFTCIKGNVRFILKCKGHYHTFLSGESYSYRSVIVPKGVSAAIQNIGIDSAYVLNMPYPAWTPDMNDEHKDNFDDFDFTI
jgi:dTDP-4-dehydrorhamnose 3,5-epimerase